MAVLSFKWLVPVLVNFLHPFYISVTEVNHNAKDKGLEISCKIFAEDLEETLKAESKTAVDLGADKQQAVNDKLIAGYVARHLAISADGRPLKLHYVGFEKQAEAIYCYFEVAGVVAPKKVDITDTILQDFTDKQINIVHMTVNGNRKSGKLDYPEKQLSFSF
jgi:hypothetical protein